MKSSQSNRLTKGTDGCKLRYTHEKRFPPSPPHLSNDGGAGGWRDKSHTPPQSPPPRNPHTLPPFPSAAIQNPFFQKSSTKFLFYENDKIPLEYLKSGSGSEGGVQYINRSGNPATRSSQCTQTTTQTYSSSTRTPGSTTTKQPR